MTTRLPRFIATTFATLMFATTIATSAPYAPNMPVEAFTAKDQHDNEFVFKPDTTRYLLVSHDMSTGKKANKALTVLGNDYLNQHQAVYMANIHGMPAIGRMFAMPKMRKYAHRIVLADDPELIAKFPEFPGKVTVLTLQNGKITHIGSWDPEVEPIEPLLK